MPRYDGVWDAAKAVCHPIETDCFAWAKFWAGGLTYYGGFLGASATAVYLLKRDRFPFWKAADMAGFAIPMGLAFGRMGCLLAGCCFGAPTPTSPWALVVPAAKPRERRAGQGAISCTSAEMWSAARFTRRKCTNRRSRSRSRRLSVSTCMPRKRYDGQVFAAFLVPLRHRALRASSSCGATIAAAASGSRRRSSSVWRSSLSRLRST